MPESVTLRVVNRLCIILALASLAACAKQVVGLADRACDAGNCADGFACLDGFCREVETSGAVGASCGDPMAVTPCVAGAKDCSQGCRQCVDSRWTECIYDCLVTGGAFARPEVCNDRDDDCDGAVDETTDSPVGCEDRYLDQDGDGFGGGLPRCACANADDGYVATAADDCNDNDATIFPGAKDVCLACETIVATNTDNDGDGISQCAGDCNDGNAGVSPAILEDVTGGNCRDGLDNDCNGLVDCADSNCQVGPARYRYGRVVTVTPQPSLANGYGFSMVFDHKSAVDAGRSLASGLDVRVFARDSGGYRELPREVGVLSGWNRNDTLIWVRNDHDRTAAETDVLLVYGVPNGGLTTFPDTNSGAYALREDFEGQGNLGGPWSVTGVSIPVGGGYMAIPNGGNRNGDPFADRTIDTIIGGRVELTVGMEVYRYGEATYGSLIQLGRGLPNIYNSSGVSTFNTAVSLGWGHWTAGTGPDFGDERFVSAGGVGYQDLGGGTGTHYMRAIVDLDARAVSATLDGGAVGPPAYGDSAVDSITTVRIAGYQVSNGGGIRYHYVSIRRMPPNAPNVAVGPELAIGPCP